MINQKAGRPHGRRLALPAAMGTTLPTTGFTVVSQSTPATSPAEPARTHPYGGPAPEFIHHCLWSRIEVATAPASHGEPFGDEDDTEDDTEEEGAED
ncbi:hypothetical protein [Nocardiopsis listeri]|uniref:hypothetical protein n=1 Tax=Nocardiopsis listeri TaxID=53440 RepID=UPI000A4BF917|nr:hypothetical protein [Nocardiopsis listeri]